MPVDVLTPNALPDKVRAAVLSEALPDERAGPRPSAQPGARSAQGCPMTRDPQRLPDYLGHILQAIQRIERYVAGIDEVVFLASEIVQDAVIRNLEVIGEASRNIEGARPDFAAAHPELPLTLASDMRTRCRTATSRSTSRSSGRPFNTTYPACRPSCRPFCQTGRLEP